MIVITTPTGQIGRHVRFQQTTFEAYKDRFVRLGISTR